MRLVTVKIPETYLEGIDELVRIGRYSSRSEVIRVAIRDLLRKELWSDDFEIAVSKRSQNSSATGSISEKKITVTL